MSDMNMMLLESYKLVTARNDYGVYGQRLIVRLVEIANRAGYHRGLDFRGGEGLRVIDKEYFGRDLIFTIPVSQLYTTAEELTYMKKALKKLTTQALECRDEEGRWRIFPMLKDVVFEKGVVRVEVKKLFMDALLDMTQGFRRYELDTVLRLRSAYSMKIFKLISETAYPITLKLEDLRGFLLGPKEAAGGKYAAPSTMIAKTIDTAKRELDSCSPYTFNYKVQYAKPTGKGRRAITGITLYPVHQLEHEDVTLRPAARSVLLSSLSMRERDLLTWRLGFTAEAVQNNLPLLETAKKSLDLAEVLERVAHFVERENPDNVVGYTVNSIKNELKELGVDCE